MEKFELYVGETGKFLNKNVVCRSGARLIIGGVCKRCAFYENSINCGIIACSPYERDDSKWVYYESRDI